MASKETLLHTIKVNRRVRKMNESKPLSNPIHPALVDGWDQLTRDQQSDKLLRWKIQVKQR